MRAVPEPPDPDSQIPRGYFANFQASTLVFSHSGCWRITARVGRKSLTFVTLVMQVSGIGRNFGYR